ncbi:hypothetical protein LA345_39690 (plasmid) [Burkholderia vietnamiensis]|nr:hypothetical protein [Burkholderia vietnamiensis]
MATINHRDVAQQKCGSDMDERLKQFMDDSERIRAHLRDFSVTIVTMTAEPKPAAIGSGTLVKIGERYGIFTAAHVVRDVPKERFCLVFAERQEGLNAFISSVRLDGGRAYPDGTSDLLDVAFLELSAEGVETVGRHKQFLPESRIEVGTAYRDARFVGYGTPRTLVAGSGTQLRAKPLFYVTEATSVRTNGRTIDDHIFLEYPRAGNIHLADGSAFGLKPDESRLLDDPRGISGGGIWTPRLDGGDYSNPETFALVGILAGFIPGCRHIVGNQIQHALMVINKAVEPN